MNNDISWTLRRRSLTIMTIVVIVFPSIAASNLLFNNNDVFAQNATNGLNNPIDTFRAEGIISSLASGVFTGEPDPEGINTWVLGGNWGLNVAEGNLTNFNVDIKMTKIDGTNSHHHSIDQVTKPSGNYTLIENEMGDLVIGNDQRILLYDNNTAISGFADVTTDGKVEWSNVPISITIMNGNILNLVISPISTDYHFKGLPIYGTVNSITSGPG